MLKPPLAISLRASLFDAVKPALHRESKNADGKFAFGNLDRRQTFRRRAFLEGAPRGFGGFLGSGAAVAKRGRFGGEDLLGLVQFRALRAFPAARFRLSGSR